MTPYYEDDYCTIYNADCREVLPTLDKVDLVLTDPPYGIGADKNTRANKQGGNAIAPSRDYGVGDWDNNPIDFELLWSLLSAGTYACCFGGNYYPLPPSKSWLVWDKETGDNWYADAELAWTNYEKAVRLKRHLWKGMLRKGKERRDHPTQKPLEVMEWCITLCPDNPQTILDPFMGSGTTLRAGKDLRRKCIGIELEEKYCEIAANRLAQEVLAL